MLQKLLRRFDKGKAADMKMPVSISAGMHISDASARPVYFVINAAVALMGITGSLFSFTGACRQRGCFDLSDSRILICILISWAIFSLGFALFERKPAASRCIICGCTAAVLIYGLINREVLSSGFMYLADNFLASLFKAYREKPLFGVTDGVMLNNGEIAQLNECAQKAAEYACVLISLLVCRTVKSPLLILFAGATYPLPGICLYYGLVPPYPFFALLLAAWCAAFAAEVTELGVFADGSARPVFTKTAAQAAAAAAIIMLLCFAGANLYADASDYKRPEKADNFRSGFEAYMNDFTWEKLSEDISDSFFSSASTATHDGKLGNVESIKFTGNNMLEVTLPADAAKTGTVYLKGFTGTEYTGSRWTEGPAMPELETKLTSPEFFSGRSLKFISGYEELKSRDVIVRNTGAARTVKYYPVNAAGLLETNGIVRRYGVYFPQKKNWRSDVIASSAKIKLSKKMTEDELRLRTYAYNNCLGIPETFTAHEAFFEGLYSSDKAMIAEYIKSELSKNYEYTLDSGKKPFGSDFAQWFLTQNRKGSCTHFASAAVLLFRSKGIPARYCEGFVIKSEDIASFQDSADENGYVTVSVPDNRAHAWAEIYVDGYGWLCFETTPGYGNVVIEDTESVNWENSPVSEIIPVQTQAPEFSEAVTSAAAVEEDSKTDSDTAEASSGYDSDGFETQVITATVTDEASQTVTASMQQEPYSASDGSYQTYGFSDGTNGAYGGSGGSGSAPNSNTDNAQTGGISITEGSEQLESNEPIYIPEAVIYIFRSFAVAAAAAAAVFVRRAAVLALRRRRIDKNPSKAAVEIYRSLVRLSGNPQCKNDKMAQEISEKTGIDIEPCAIVINTALKARFGGGISSEEAYSSAKAYNKAAMHFYSSRSSRLAAIFIFCTDRYV